MLEYLLFGGIALIVVMLSGLQKRVNNLINGNDERLYLLQKELSELRRIILERDSRPASPPAPPVVEEPKTTIAEVVAPLVEAQPEIQSVPVEEITPEPIAEEVEKPLTVADIEAMYADVPVQKEETKTLSGSLEISEEVQPLHTETATAPVQTETLPPAKEIDYEKYIGENLISKIGIAILVLAIGFFVKFAIDNNWINEVGRVCIGLASGGILVGLAHRLRTDYKAFSSVLVGGGLAVFYFTIALAYHQFHLFDQTVSFGIMVVITIFAVVLSLLYDRQELAVISMVGGYATPFLVSNGSGNYIALFSYLCILNSGLLIIAYMRMWRLLNLLAFLFTIAIFALWLFTGTDTSVTVCRNAFIFATVFFLFFFSAGLAHNIKEKKKFLPIDFSMLLANSVWYFSTGLFLIYTMHAEAYKGLFSASMAAFHLVVSYFLIRHQRTDKNILYLLIGITLTFISITAPLQLEGSFITLFWASEAVLLYWLYTRSQIRIIAIGSTVVSFIALLSLVLNWSDNYAGFQGGTYLNVIINKPFITSVYAALCAMALYYLRVRNTSEQKPDQPFPILIPAKAYLAASMLIAFFVGLLEISYQFGHRIVGSDVYAAFDMLYVLLFVNGAIYLLRRYEHIRLTPYHVGLLLGVLVAVYILQLPFSYELFHTLLLQGKYVGLFSAHWISAVIVAAMLWRIITMIRGYETSNADTKKSLAWILSAVIVVFLSAEIYLMALGLFYHDDTMLDALTRVFIKAMLPIIWGVSSFAFMWAGMKYQYKPLRIISLTLFAVTLLKLFLFDISNVPVGGKIAAFFCLGVLLLVVSFMYQRLKKILIDGGDKQE